jgi:hypothetical protein
MTIDILKVILIPKCRSKGHFFALGVGQRQTSQFFGSFCLHHSLSKEFGSASHHHSLSKEFGSASHQAQVHIFSNFDSCKKCSAPSLLY